MLSNFLNQLPLTLEIALSLRNAQSLGAAKINPSFVANPNWDAFGSQLGFLRFEQMDQPALSNCFRSRCSPLAFLPSDNGRFRIFFAGRYMGGLWSAAEMVSVKLAQPQSESELIHLLDCIAAESGLERSPPQTKTPEVT